MASAVGGFVETCNHFLSFTLGEGLTPTAANGEVSGRIVDDIGKPVEGAAIRMNGTENRLTVTDAQGNYHFDNVETNGFYTVTPARPNFTFNPAQRSFSQLGQHTDAAFTASSSGTKLNPLDASEFFVRQRMSTCSIASLTKQVSTFGSTRSNRAAGTLNVAKPNALTLQQPSSYPRSSNRRVIWFIELISLRMAIYRTRRYRSSSATSSPTHRRLAMK